MAVRISRLPHVPRLGRAARLEVGVLLAPLVVLALAIAFLARGWEGGGRYGDEASRQFFDSQRHSLIGADGGGTEAAKGQR